MPRGALKPRLGAASTPDIKQEINAYIERISAPPDAQQFGGGDDGSSYVTDNNSVTASHVSAAAAEHGARDQLWYRLHHRYSGDKEGRLATQAKVREYQLEAVREEGRVLRDYMLEMDEGW